MQILIAKTLVRSACLLFLLASFAAAAAGQSTDVAAPSPVRTNEVEGSIRARDLGDPRVTDHYYAFSGTPGDVLITVDSRNLNGDVDVFTLSGLQPLLKFTVYAGSSSLITKSIYLRKQEDLILRVEGRTPNDDDATYRIRFGGSFAPITSAPWLSESESAAQPATAVAETTKKGRRVSSTGARIYEPPTEVAEAPTPEPTPEPVPAESPEAAAPETVAAKPKPGNSRVRRPATTPRPTTRKTKPAPTKPEESAAKDETETTPAESSEAEAKPPIPRRRPTRRTATTRTTKPTPAPAQEIEEGGPRLLIETNDGTLVDRYMSSVRRVTVENGQVVVVGRDGKIQRISLASVVRMTISP